MRVSAWWWWWRRRRGGTVTPGSGRVRAGFLALLLAVTLCVYGYWRVLAPFALRHTSLAQWFDTRSSLIETLTSSPARSTQKRKSHSPSEPRTPNSLSNTYRSLHSTSTPVIINGHTAVSEQVREEVHKNNQSLAQSTKRQSEGEGETRYQIDFPSWWDTEGNAEGTEGGDVAWTVEEDVWEYRGGEGEDGDGGGGGGGAAGEGGGEEESVGVETGGVSFLAGGEDYDNCGGFHEGGVNFSTGGEGYGGEFFGSGGDEGTEAVVEEEKDGQGHSRKEKKEKVMKWEKQSDEKQLSGDGEYSQTPARQDQEEDRRGRNDQKEERRKTQDLMKKKRGVEDQERKERRGKEEKEGDKRGMKDQEEDKQNNCQEGSKIQENDEKEDESQGKGQKEDRREKQEEDRELKEYHKVNWEEQQNLMNEGHRNHGKQNYSKETNVKRKTKTAEVERGRMAGEVKEEHRHRTLKVMEERGQRMSKEEEGKPVQRSSEVEEERGQRANESDGNQQGHSKNEMKVERGLRSPRVILLLSTWRSGSTFMGELFATADNNNTFYSYEPLHEWKVRLVREDSGRARAAVQLLTDLFHCRLHLHPHHLAYMTSKHWYMRWNTRLASHCLPRDQCANVTLATHLCTTARIHVAKVVRLGLRWVMPLLQDPSLNLQLVVLVRDPRAVLSSRGRVSWCHDPSCSHPPTVCHAMYQDLRLLPHLLRQFPTRVKMVQYERFLLDLPTSLPGLLSFLHLPLSSAHLHLLILAAKSRRPSRAESKRAKRRKRSTQFDSGKSRKNSLHPSSVNENTKERKRKRQRASLFIGGNHQELTEGPDQNERLDQRLAPKMLRKSNETSYEHFFDTPKKRSGHILEDKGSHDEGLGKGLAEKLGWSGRGTYGTERELVLQQADLWRYRTSFRQVVEYQRHCGRVLALLGLRVFTSRAQLSNHAIPVLLTPSQQQQHSRRALLPLS